MTKKDRLLIKKYHKLRGTGEPDLKLDNLMAVYDESSKTRQLQFRSEMKAYIKAVSDDEILPGDALGRPELPK